MISLDTNVIFSVLNPHDTNHSAARTLLTSTERLVISPVVYSELSASPDFSGIQVFLEKAQIEVLWEMPEDIWIGAGVALGQYASLRRSGKLPRRIAADFLIGAHAKYYGLSLISFDNTVYKAVFPDLKLVQ
jgi:predicted nucleic acid-binding protein